MARRVAAVILSTAALALTSACSSEDDYYKRDPYRDDRTINSGLKHAEDAFVTVLRARNVPAIRAFYTAPPWTRSMNHFVRGYGGHPVRTTGRSPGDDATANQDLSVTCGPGDVQRVEVAWAWFDGAWRAWPADQDHQYPGCS